VISSAPAHFTRDLELEALQTAVRWPQPTPATILALAGRFAARGQTQEAFEFFRERADAVPTQPLFRAFEAQFQLKLVSSVPAAERPAWLDAAVRKLDRAVELGPGMTTYLRGMALAQLPAVVGTAQAATQDLEWVLANGDRLPRGLRRGAYRALAKTYATLGRLADSQVALTRSGYPSLDSDLPTFVTDYSLTIRDGFRFTQPRLVELAPDTYVAQGFDFGDFAFIVTGDQIVAIDAGTSPSHARAALEELRKISSFPITDVIVTHCHWDHIGGLNALLDTGTQIVAQANFADELRIVNESGVAFRTFFGPEGKKSFELRPHRLVREAESVSIGGTEFRLYPVYGGETADALLIYLPASGVMFTGDVFMPFLGAPFLAEGSAEGLFETLELVQRVGPRLLVHGHTPLTEQFTIEVVPALAAALRELYQQVLEGVRSAMTLVQILRGNVLPAVLRSNPAAVVPYLLMRENFVKRVYHQRSGYWKPDGEGVEVFGPDEWAAALALLADGRPEAFIESARTLLAQHDDALALRLVELGVRKFTDSRELVDLRQQALQRLRALHQQLNPFKFIVYSEWAQSELTPVE
jgi:glyoxylase-like metal-dependent hydrolase (beta-lactamase superfamily II)